ncbi:MAG: molybdopterin-dependent oxidoreductase [Gammaproteobacteria bacterium]|nr:molybdopterin-dependent oxidoreductase [Gammaproteobacteria bacterium]
MNHTNTPSAEPLPIRGRVDFDRVVRTVCSPNCSGSCGISAFVKDDRLLRVEPADFPDPKYKRICLKGISMAMQRVEHPDRVLYPMRRKGARGAGAWERLSWDHAYDYLAERLTRISDKYGPAANSWISMTGNYGIMALMLSQRIANSLGGTAFTNLGIMGDLGANMGFLPTLGVHQEAHDWSDLVGARLIMMFGKNIADTEHSDMHFLMEAMEQGAKLIVVDPRYSRTATKADQWISLRPGTDAALVLGMINVIVKEGLFDENFVRQHSNAPYLVRTDSGRLLRFNDLVEGGSDDYVIFDAVSATYLPASAAAEPKLRGVFEVFLKDGCAIECRPSFDLMVDAWQRFTPDHVESICDVPAELVRKLALAYATSHPASLWVGQGSQRYYHGHLAYRAVITLAALCGNIGKPHAGVSWGGGTLLRLILGTPDSWLAPAGARGTSYPGTRMHDIIATGDPYPIKSLWSHNYGFGTQNPRRKRFFEEILPKLDLFIVTEQLMTHAAKHADIVLPAVSYYEDDADIVGSWNNMYLQMRRAAIPPIGEAKTDWQIFKDLCERMGKADGWDMSAEQSCEFILRESPDPIFRNTDWEALKKNGVVRVPVKDPHVPFDDLKFPTPSGRVELYTEQLKDFGQEILVFEEPLESNRNPKSSQYPLTFMTAHQMHTVHSQHTRLPWIRELLPGPRLEMNPIDARLRDIADGDLVSVYNDRGSIKVYVTLTEAMKPGSLNLPQGWWPEDFPEGHYSDLTHVTLNPVQEAILETNFAPFDNLVEVIKSERAL